MKLISKQLVSSEYREFLQQDLSKATVCRFLVAYVSQDGLNAIDSSKLLKTLCDQRSFGVASISCACGYEPLMDLQSTLGPGFPARLKYFMDPKVLYSDEPSELTLFHSKLVYLHLENDRKSIIYLGSHNWTGRALGPGSPRNAEVSIRLEFDFLPEHLEGKGTSVAAEVNRHLLNAWAAPLCFPATPDFEQNFEEWMQKGCHRAPKSPVKQAIVILAVCKMVPKPSDWFGIQNAGIYFQALEESEGRAIFESNGPILILV